MDMIPTPSQKLVQRDMIVIADGMHAIGYMNSLDEVSKTLAGEDTGVIYGPFFAARQILPTGSVTPMNWIASKKKFIVEKRTPEAIVGEVQNELADIVKKACGMVPDKRNGYGVIFDGLPHFAKDWKQYLASPTGLTFTVSVVGYDVKNPNL